MRRVNGRAVGCVAWMSAVSVAERMAGGVREDRL